MICAESATSLGALKMALNQEQVARLRQMSPDNRQSFHLNRIANSLEAIQVLLTGQITQSVRNANGANEDIGR
jgi:hypothetical protein